MQHKEQKIPQFCNCWGKVFALQLLHNVHTRKLAHLFDWRDRAVPFFVFNKLYLPYQRKLFVWSCLYFVTWSKKYRSIYSFWDVLDKKGTVKIILNFSFCSSIIIIKRTLRAKYSSKMQFVHKPLYTRCKNKYKVLMFDEMYVWCHKFETRNFCD